MKRTPSPLWIERAGGGTGEEGGSPPFEEIPLPVARILAGKGLKTRKEVEEFLDPGLSSLPSPFLIPDLQRGARRLIEAIEGREKACIYSDYDADGVTGAAILSMALKGFGTPHFAYIPHRIREGYGLNRHAVKEIARHGAKLLVTVDCGTNQEEVIAMAEREGMDVIVTDHHQISDRGKEYYPYPFINPTRDPGSPFSEISGAGVVFNLLRGLGRTLEEGGRPIPPELDLKGYLDLLATGTVADIVPLLGFNRVVVVYGLRRMKRNPGAGIRALMEVSGIDTFRAEVTPYDIGFKIAPRLNASGRLGDVMEAFELLTTDDGARAQRLARKLDMENRERQAMEERVLNNALSRLEASPGFKERRGIVIGSPDYHPGVIGIVASKLAEEFYRPVILFSLDEEKGEAKGSGRSIPGCDILSLILPSKGLFSAFGGHRGACGIRMPLENLEPFTREFEKRCDQELAPGDIVPKLFFDGELEPRDIDLALAEWIRRLSPFGPGNPEPVFLARGVVMRGYREVRGGHLKLWMRYGETPLQGIVFNGTHYRDLLDEWGARGVDLALHLRINEWQGSRSPELQILDIKRRGANPDPGVHREL